MFIKEKKVKSSSEATIDYLEIDKSVYKIISVKNAEGLPVEFYDLPFALYVPKANTEYTIEYARMK